MAQPTADKVITQAKKYVRSAAYGSPNKFSKWYGFGNQVVAWCGIFVYYVLTAAGGKTLMNGCSNKAYIPSVWNWGKAKGYTKSTPKKGDLVIFDWDRDGGCDHIGFVVKDMGNGYVQTVEGNTSNTNNGNGGCVQIRTRSKSLIKGYIRLPYGKATTSSTTSTKKAYTGTFPTRPARGYFKKGDKGTQVKNLQKFLNWAVSSKLTVDGIAGAKTIAAVKTFQKKVGISADGLFGKSTLTKAKAYKK